MFDFINELFFILNNQNNNIIIGIVYIGICLFSILLRVIICIGYQSNYAFFKLYSKEIKTRAEIKESKFGLLNRVVSDYMKSADKNASRIDVRAIVGKYMLRLRFLGWSYTGIESFVTSMEQGMVFVAILLAVVFGDFRFVYGTLAVAAFLLFRLLAAVFDFSLTKGLLTEEITEYVEREIGQFYTGDMSSAVFRLKNDLTAALARQAEVINESMKKLGGDLSSMIKLSMEESARNMTAAAAKTGEYMDNLKKPLEDWRDSLIQAEKLQNKINASVAQLDDAGVKLGGAFELADVTLKEYSKRIMEQTMSIKEQINALVSTANSINETNSTAAKNNEGVAKQLHYIEKNQEVLEQSLQQYEESLENITKRLGDGLSSIMSYQMQNSYNAANEALQSNLNRIINSNNELMTRLHELFDQLLAQSRGEMKAVLQLKEQMELQFTMLEETRETDSKGI